MQTVDNSQSKSVTQPRNKRVLLCDGKDMAFDVVDVMLLRFKICNYFMAGDLLNAQASSNVTWA